MKKLIMLIILITAAAGLCGCDDTMITRRDAELIEQNGAGISVRKVGEEQTEPGSESFSLKEGKTSGVSSAEQRILNLREPGKYNGYTVTVEDALLTGNINGLTELVPKDRAGAYLQYITKVMDAGNELFQADGSVKVSDFGIIFIRVRIKNEENYSREIFMKPYIYRHPSKEKYTRINIGTAFFEHVKEAFDSKYTFQPFEEIDTVVALLVAEKIKESDMNDIHMSTSFLNDTGVDKLPSEGGMFRLTDSEEKSGE